MTTEEPHQNSERAENMARTKVKAEAAETERRVSPTGLVTTSFNLPEGLIRRIDKERRPNEYGYKPSRSSVVRGALEAHFTKRA